MIGSVWVVYLCECVRGWDKKRISVADDSIINIAANFGNSRQQNSIFPRRCSKKYENHHTPHIVCLNCKYIAAFIVLQWRIEQRQDGQKNKRMGKRHRRRPMQCALNNNLPQKYWARHKFAKYKNWFAILRKSNNLRISVMFFFSFIFCLSIFCRRIRFVTLRDYVLYYSCSLLDILFYQYEQSRKNEHENDGCKI